MKQITWIKEKEAAERLGYKDPVSLRKNVKKGVFDISFTHVNGRNFQYDEKAIQRLLDKNAQIIK